MVDRKMASSSSSLAPPLGLPTGRTDVEEGEELIPSAVTSSPCALGEALKEKFPVKPQEGVSQAAATIAASWRSRVGHHTRNIEAPASSRAGAEVGDIFESTQYGTRTNSEEAFQCAHGAALAVCALRRYRGQRLQGRRD